MREVAALAGVSLKTVSRVVNRESGVSDELAARVDQAAAQLDYRPNLTASNLRRADHRTGTIGLLVEDVANEFFASIHRGVEDVAREHRAAVVAASIDRNPEREHDLVGAFADRRVDGLIIAPTSLDQGYLASELRSGWPVVVVDRPTQRRRRREQRRPRSSARRRGQRAAHVASLAASIPGGGSSADVVIAGTFDVGTGASTFRTRADLVDLIQEDDAVIFGRA
jgi:ABC-type sugar transport system substrate-binding protein